MAYEFEGVESRTKTRPLTAVEEERAVLAVAGYAVRIVLGVDQTAELLDILGLRSAAEERSARRTK